MRATALRVEAAAFALRAGEQVGRVDLPAGRIISTVRAPVRDPGRDLNNRPEPPQPALNPELDGSGRRIGRGL
jgi:hypothetical protein